MKVNDVFIKWSKLVPFPWSKKKIKKAGFDPCQFVIDFGDELKKCSDRKSFRLEKLFANLKTLQKELKNP